MAKAKRSETLRQPGESGMQYASRMARLKQNMRDKAEPLVTPEAEQHGKYVSHGKGKVNLAVSQLEQWKHKSLLNEVQLAGIYYCLRIWQALPPPPQCTGAYGERIGGGSGSYESDGAILRYLEAQQDLKRISGGIGKSGEWEEGYIFLKHYWDVFENILRFDMSIKEASLRMGYSESAGAARCLTIVCYVAEMIADRERLAPYTGIRSANY
jgi:hypothetical protein